MKLIRVDYTFKKALLGQYLYILFLFIIAFFLLLICILLIQNIVSKRDEFIATQQEIEETERRIARVDSFKIISPNQIVAYNNMLTELIPESDTNLSVYFVLDSLAEKTNFELSNYRIRKSGEESETITFTVSGTGNEEEFLYFLENYRYITQRLITIQNISINNNDTKEVEMELTLYTYKPGVSLTQRTDISQQDLGLLSFIEGTYFERSPIFTPTKLPEEEEKEQEATQPAEITISPPPQSTQEAPLRPTANPSIRPSITGSATPSGTLSPRIISPTPSPQLITPTPSPINTEVNDTTPTGQSPITTESVAPTKGG